MLKDSIAGYAPIQLANFNLAGETLILLGTLKANPGGENTACLGQVKIWQNDHQWFLLLSFAVSGADHQQL